MINKSVLFVYHSSIVYYIVAYCDAMHFAVYLYFPYFLRFKKHFNKQSISQK